MACLFSNGDRNRYVVVGIAMYQDVLDNVGDFNPIMFTKVMPFENLFSKVKSEVESGLIRGTNDGNILSNFVSLKLALIILLTTLQ